MNKFRKYSAVMLFTVSLAVLSLLSGCGSGGGSGTSPAVQGGSGGTIQGMAVKGPVSNALVTAYGITNGAMAAQVASGKTDDKGSFSLSIGDYSGPLMLQMSGGAYIDEATGLTMAMSPGNVMTAVIPLVMSNETISNLQVTPLTSMAQAMARNMAGGMTGENITAANAAVGGYFMVGDILHTVPMNPLSSGSGNTATQDMKNYGMAIAAMSQSAKDLGMSSSSSMVTDMMNDASDGVMNGMMGSTPVKMGGMSVGSSMMTSTTSTIGTSGLATAMATFITSSMNQSGVTEPEMQPLMNQLNSTNGTI